MSFKYCTTRDKDSFQFYRLPKKILNEPEYKTLTAGAKLLFACMLDRKGLSVKSGWHDEHGHVYIYYTLKQICDDLSVGRQKAVNMLSELEKADLIRRVRQGLGRPTRIYVGCIKDHKQASPVRETDYETPEAVCETDNMTTTVLNTRPEKDDNHPPESALDRLLEECKRDSINTNDTDKEYIYTESSFGNREPASKEAYEREMPMTREEVLEEYRKMKERGEEDMKLVELMLLATN